MKEYVKINAPYLRDGKTLQIGQWCRDELATLAGVPWSWTEKVDGTNIRLGLHENGLAIGGRTDNAQIPADLYAAIVALDLEPKMRALFAEGGATLYGEGYGPKVQGGGKYRQDMGFVLFDVLVGSYWLRRADVVDVADKLGVHVVPEVLIGTVAEAEALVRGGLRSTWGDFEAEGVVGTPVGGFLFRDGRPIKLKVKAKDYRP